MRSGLLVVLLGCAGSSGPDRVDPAVFEPTVPPAPSSPTETTEPASTAPAPERLPLEIQFLAVGGFVLRYGDSAVMTPPMYSNPDFLETTLGTIASDPELVERFSEGVRLDDVHAILVGHGHYDHLLDAPTLWPRTAQATLYGNATVAHLLAAWLPEPPAGCEDRQPPSVLIPAERIVQVDDPEGRLGRDLVDYRLCPALDPGQGSGQGDWIAVEGAPIRLRALCSMHPDQFGPIHFAPGHLTEDACEPPERAEDWKEGLTLSWLVDFLDEETGEIVHRVYYQDAPTEPPVGLFHPELLEEKRVDVALLTVGSYPSVPDHPGATLSLMKPRYTVGGHWEDFFFTLDWPTRPIFGHNLEEYAANAATALGSEEQPAVLVDGVPQQARQWIPEPGTTFLFPAEP